MDEVIINDNYIKAMGNANKSDIYVYFTEYSAPVVFEQSSICLLNLYPLGIPVGYTVRSYSPFSQVIREFTSEIVTKQI